MKKNLSYREQLLELARIYKISEVQNYIKRKKNLTTHQIEHILKKNNVPIPKDFNVSFFKKSITNPISKVGKGISGLYDNTTGEVGKFFKRTKKGATGLYDDTTGGVGNFFIRLWKNTGSLGIGILNLIPKVSQTVSNFISNALVDTFSSFYTSEVEKTKTNKLIKGFGVVVFICAIGIIFFTFKENFYQNNTTQSVQAEKDKAKKIEKQKEVKKKEEKKLEKKEQQKQVKKPEIKKKPETKKEKSPSQVTELFYAVS